MKLFFKLPNENTKKNIIKQQAESVQICILNIKTAMWFVLDENMFLFEVMTY